MGMKIFSYRDGRNTPSTLLGSLITGNGAAFLPRGSLHPLLVKAGPKTPIEPTLAQEDAIAAYSAYYTKYYEAGGVQRHLSAVLGGGRPVFAGKDKDGLYLTTEVPESGVSDNHTSFWAALSGSRGRIAIDALITGSPMDATIAALVGAARHYGGDGTYEIVYDITATRDTLRYSHLGYDPTASVGTPLANALWYMYPTTTYSTSAPITQANNLYKSYMKAGHIVAALTCNASGGGINGTANARLVIIRMRCSRPSRIAFMKLSYLIDYVESAYKTDGSQNLVPRWTGQFVYSHDLWITSGSGAIQALGVKPTYEYAGSGQFYKQYANNGLLEDYSYTQTTAPFWAAALEQYVDNAADGGKAAWYFPASAKAGPYHTPANYVFNFPMNAVTWKDAALADLGLPDIISWGAVISPADFARRAFILKHRAMPIGCDLAANPLADYKMYVETLPSPVALETAIVSPVAALGLRTRTDSERVAGAMELVDGFTSADLTAVRAQLVAKPRSFYGIVGPRVAPPVGVLARTKIQQAAQEAGESIYDEIFIPKDPDDPSGVSVTFKTADNACNTFRSKAEKSKRIGLCVSAPNGSYSGVPLTMYVHWDGADFVACTTATILKPATAEELIDMYAGFVTGRYPVFVTSAKTSAQYLGYVSPYGRSNYPEHNDLASDLFFGKSFGSITSNSSGTDAGLYSAEGQLRDGWLKPIEEWKPEFWLSTCASKSWQIESLLGNILTNPCGVGAFTHEQISAIAQELDE